MSGDVFKAKIVFEKLGQIFVLKISMMKLVMIFNVLKLLNHYKFGFKKQYDIC